ncbi:MAG: ArsR/SmtB family transcription factor [Alphaproteobacteria bacterium]
MNRAHGGDHCGPSALGEEDAADALAALGNRTRLRLFKLLMRAGPEGLIVGEVQRHMDMPASTLAHHLAALARAGLVSQERRGREVVCTADYATMHGLVGWLTQECCTGVRLASKVGAA